MAFEDTQGLDQERLASEPAKLFAVAAQARPLPGGRDQDRYGSGFLIRHRLLPSYPFSITCCVLRTA